MSELDKSARHISYTWTNPELRQDFPENQKSLPALHSKFDMVRHPDTKVQLEDMGKTEAQRREESSSGSQMVKRHKPFPELRPRNEPTPIRESFNNEWIRELRRARIAEREARSAHAKADLPETVRARGRERSI